MTAIAAHRQRTEAKEAQFRYGIVLGIILVLLMFQILAPEAAWARAVSIALAGAALTVSVATARARGSVRRIRSRIVAVFALLVVVGIATGVLSEGVTFLIGTLLLIAIPVALGGGLLRLTNEEGVTVQAVAGALAIYLVVGLVFASLVSFVARVGSASYFAQPGPISSGARVYYSFTVLTTTGFGDYTPATKVGHALAVLEMLTGQLYLVTVIGILVGNFVRRKR